MLFQHRPVRLTRLVAVLSAAALATVSVVPAAAQVTPTTRVVQPGETLWQIAQDAGMDTGALMRLNDLSDADLLMAGQVLRVAAAPVAPAMPVPLSTYSVAEGDALWSIATRLGVTADQLIEANKLDNPDALFVGMQLAVPAGARPSTPVAATPAPAAPAAAPAPADPAVATAAPALAAPRPKKTLFTTYTVQQGETLSAIARQYNLTPSELAQASGISDPNQIAIGSVVKIPVPGREHVVAAGETLYAIAASERIDLGSLIDFNEIMDPGMLLVGQVLVIPGAAPQAAAAVTPPPASTAAPVAPPAATPAVATPIPVPSAAPPPVTATPVTTTPTPTAPAAKPSATTTPVSTPLPARKPVAIPPGTPTDGIVGQAAKLLGMPYVFGGSGPSSFDCSGLVWYAAKQAGLSLPRGLFAQYAAGAHPSRDSLRPGDLVFFQNTYMPGLSHNGIYIGNNLFINAADESTGVVISNMTNEYWATRFYGATRPA